jgi:organic hydroperoxide reductase OsmC/OhrA
MTGKTDKHFFFEVQLNWLADTTGILTAKNASGTIHVATSPKFGGKGKPWTPEYLFLCSISSCYLSTYLLFAGKLGFEISDFECNIIGQVEIIERKYKFTTINLFPKVYIKDEQLRQKAIKAIEKTNRHCLVVNSVNVEIFYHSEILVDPNPRLKKKKEPSVNNQP